MEILLHDGGFQVSIWAQELFRRCGSCLSGHDVNSPGLAIFLGSEWSNRRDKLEGQGSKPLGYVSRRIGWGGRGRSSSKRRRRRRRRRRSGRRRSRRRRRRRRRGRRRRRR
jgi:hypothetical protein